MSFFDQPLVADKEEANTRGDFKPLPVGEYTLIIEKADLGPNKRGKEMLTLVFKVEVGEYEGRTIFHNFNLEHDNEKVVNIAKSQLHALLIMTGLRSITHPDELVGHSFRAKVIVKDYIDPGTGQKKYSNEALLTIKKDAETPTVNATPAAATTTAQRPAPAASKW